MKFLLSFNLSLLEAYSAIAFVDLVLKLGILRRTWLFFFNGIDCYMQKMFYTQILNFYRLVV